MLNFQPVFPLAGYSGSLLAANARRRAGLPQVRARMAELAAPKTEHAIADAVIQALTFG